MPNISWTYFPIHSPITLDMIRAKLDPQNTDKYDDIDSFIDDVKMMINNVYLFHRVSNLLASIVIETAIHGQNKSNI